MRNSPDGLCEKIGSHNRNEHYRLPTAGYRDAMNKRARLDNSNQTPNYSQRDVDICDLKRHHTRVSMVSAIIAHTIFVMGVINSKCTTITNKHTNYISLAITPSPCYAK
jgi:hypothetical protein